MKAVIQRVTKAKVSVNGETTGEINKGFLVLLGVQEGDTQEDMMLLAKKTAGIRIFTDENDKMNLSLDQIDGEVLVVSQFTLCADTSHGRRPSFISSAKPEIANELYMKYCEQLRNLGVKKVATGIFGADMQVELVNDGPVTIIMDTNEWKKR